jgi:ribose transport system substrate-binding protein
MAMGFDLAQGWAYYLGREVKGFGGTFETRDPNWSVEAGAQAITEAISSDPKPSVLVVHSPDLNSYSKLFKKAQAAGIYVVLIDNPTYVPTFRCPVSAPEAPNAPSRDETESQQGCRN